MVEPYLSTSDLRRLAPHTHPFRRMMATWGQFFPTAAQAHSGGEPAAKLGGGAASDAAGPAAVAAAATESKKGR